MPSSSCPSSSGPGLDKKIGHRRVDASGETTYKKVHLQSHISFTVSQSQSQYQSSCTSGCWHIKCAPCWISAIVFPFNSGNHQTALGFWKWLHCILHIHIQYIWYNVIYWDIQISKSYDFIHNIHPSILFCLSGAGSRGQQSKQRCPDFPLPRHVLQLFRGESSFRPPVSGILSFRSWPKAHDHRWE